MTITAGEAVTTVTDEVFVRKIAVLPQEHLIRHAYGMWHLPLKGKAIKNHGEMKIIESRQKM